MCSIMDEIDAVGQSVGGFCSLCLASQANAAEATDGLPRGIYLIHYGTHTENILVE